MIKKIALSSFASVILLSQVANAEIKLGDKGSLGTIAFNAGYNSAYVWRGIDQNSGSGSPYIGADLTTPIGLYIGTWTAASTAGLGNGSGNPNQEIDIYAGIAKTFGAVTADVGVIEYRYPGSNKPSGPNNFLEYYGKLKLAPDKAPYSLQLAYYIDDTEGQVSSTKKGNGKSYQEISGSYNFPVFTVTASYGEYKSETDTTTITVSKSMFDLNFSASYIDADAKVATSSAANRTNSNKEFFVVNVSKTF
jgi:uncharacterized protein (TIGR02001 family)